MGFLSGVLSNIKEHLGQHKGQITDAIEALKTNKHAGKNGFKISIVSVVAGVRGYNGNVKSSNNDVLKPLQLLLNYTKKNGGELINSINKIQVNDPTDPLLASAARSCGDRLKEATDRSKRCAEFLDPEADKNTKMKQNINDLNDKLRDKVLHVRKLVEYESQRLASVHKRKDEELKETRELIKDAFAKLKSCINNKVAEDVKNLVAHLSERVKKILKKLNEINSNLQKYINELSKWIEEADEFATAALERINKILKHMDGTASTYTMNVKTAADALGRDVKTLKDAGQYVRETIGEWVSNGTEKVAQLDEWKKAAQSVISGAVSKAREVHERLSETKPDGGEKTDIGKGIDEITKAGEAVNEVNTQLQTKLAELGDWNEKATGIVNAAKSAVKEVIKRVDRNIASNVINGGPAINKQANELAKKSKELLDAYLAAKNGLHTLVKNINDAVDGLKNFIIQDLTSLKGKVEKKIGEHVTDIINAVLKTAGTADMSNYDTALGVEQLKTVKWSDALKRIIEVGTNGANNISMSLEMVLLHLKKQLSLKSGSTIESLQNSVHRETVVAINSIIEEFKKKAGEEFKNLEQMRSDGDPGEASFKSIMEVYHSNIQSNKPLRNAIVAVSSAMKHFEKLEAFDKQQSELQQGRIGAAKKAVDDHVAVIIKQLRDIIKLVDNRRITTPSDQDDRPDGIQQQLDSLTMGLSDSATSWRKDGGVNIDSLKKITNGIGQFQSETLQHQPGKITGGIATIRDELTNLSDTFLLNANKKDVIKRLEDLNGAGFANSEIWPDQQSTKGFDKIKQDITTALTNIQTQVTDNLGILATFDETALKQFEAVKENLTQLCAAVEKEGESGRDVLKALLNTTIKEKLARIKTKLDELRTFDLRAAIRDAENFLTSAVPTAQATIASIGKVVSSKVEEAQNDLITQVNKNYVTSVKAILLEFAEKAEKELEPLPKKITDDLDIGYKGFMKTFEDRFVITINTMKQVNSDISANVFQEEVPPKYPLGKATEILRNAFTLLFNNLKSQPDFEVDYKRMRRTNAALAKMLEGLKNAEHFNYEFCGNVDSFGNQVGRLNPTNFGDGKNPTILNALKAGFTPLVDELKKAYVSSYSGRQWQEEELGYYAKIGLTITPILYHELTILKHGLDIYDWTAHKIYDAQTPTSSLHALFFRDNGYDVHRPPNAEHGELNHRNDFNGNSILAHLTNKTHNLFSQRSSPVTGIPPSTSGPDELDVTFAEESGLIQKLYDFLQMYFRVCHLTRVEKPRAPCSVYEILVWCCGLQFNPVYGKLKKHIESEFMLEDKERPGEKKLQPFDAHPSPFEHTHIDEALYKVSAHSHAVLTAILGHGHKDGIYACEFSSNSLQLDYPTSMIQLLCTLFDLLKRLYHQLYFLLRQCQLTTQLSGWRDCHYGRYIGGSGWQCNTKQCPKQDCDQRHGQSGNQTGEQYPNCGVKSPLQSFLEDGLKGHLPHSVTARGSSLSCGTCGSTPGMPCRTPMGFAEIGTIASHTMIGQDICEVLEAYCGSAKSPLTRLCSHFNCLMPSAPKTLADMFSFYYHLTDRWGMHGDGHKREAFEDKVKAANFGRTYDELNVYHLFSPSHSAAWKGHAAGSLASLVCLSRDAVVCGPYLRPITHAIYDTFSSTHADKYLSWIVYLSATFYDLLKKLYDECNSKCGSKGSNCHVKACIKGCPTTSKQDPPRYHDAKCKSIVKCNSTLPILAKYGFVLGDPERLNGSERPQTKRTCRDFCDVFAEAFDKDSHLVQLFKAIDKFIFTIRAPFFWMTVALWSLSLFYLICVMVGRLDLLHIRSHLRIPSSHKITAQSLLAAAQVGRLAKISYLQP